MNALGGEDLLVFCLIYPKDGVEACVLVSRKKSLSAFPPFDAMVLIQLPVDPSFFFPAVYFSASVEWQTAIIIMAE